MILLIVGKVCHRNTEEFNSFANHAWMFKEKDGFKRVCERFISQLQHIIAAKDGPIERY